MLSIRTTPSTVTKLSPFFQVYGVQPYLSSDFLTDIQVEENSQRHETQVSRRIADTQVSTLKNIQNRHDKNQRQRKKKGRFIYFPKGTLVDVWRPYDTNDGRQTRKFTRHWSRPYKVVEHHFDTPYQVRVGPADDSGTWQRPIHVDHVRKRRPFVPPTDKLLPGGWQPVAPPYDLHKNCKTDLEQRFHQEIQINHSIDPNYLQKINQPKHGSEPNSGIDQQMSIEELTKQYKIRYPNGFPDHEEESTDSENTDEEDNFQWLQEAARSRNTEHQETQQTIEQQLTENQTKQEKRFDEPPKFKVPLTQEKVDHNDLRRRLSRDSITSQHSKRGRSPSQDEDPEPPSRKTRTDPISYLSR